MNQNKNKISLVLIGVGIFLIFILYSSAFVIYEGRQVVVTQFGKPIRTVKDAGLHWKIPFIQDVRVIDLRILNWDGEPNQIPTKDKKYIRVDTTVRWKIVDPLKFITQLQTENGARSRLDTILDAATRDVISGHNLVEAVRNSNDIFDNIEKKKLEFQEALEKGGKELNDMEENITGDIEKIEIGRERLSELVLERAKEELLPLGIELIDVQLRRIAYEKSVEQKVFTRMISERQRVAELIRSIGKGEQAKVEGKTERDLQRIKSVAYRRVQEIKGEADAKATIIYAKALNQNPEFYKFLRSLEAYEKSVSGDGTFILSTDSDFWKVLKKSQ